MKLNLSFIQADRGVPASDTFFRAWEGFRKRGVPCELFEPQQLRQGALPLARDTLVAGGVPVVEDALTALGIAVPLADNLPTCLARYRGRRVWTSTWGELRARYGRTGPPEPLWVKSLRRNKGAPSIAVYDADDIAPGIDPEIRRVGACPEIGIDDLFTTTGRRHAHQAETQAVLQYAENHVVADLIRGHQVERVSRDESLALKLAVVQEHLGEP